MPVEEIEDLPAEVTRLRAVLARVTEERDQLKKKVANLTVALSGRARRVVGMIERGDSEGRAAARTLLMAD